MSQEPQSCCPVCTLYLRPGISLPTHLNTHPKKHVIRALLILTNQTSNLSKSIEQSEEHLSDDSSSSSSVSSSHSVTYNTQDVNNADKNSPIYCSSPKSQNSHALSELRDALEDPDDEIIDVGDNHNITFENDCPQEFDEDQPDDSSSYHGQSNESTRNREESNETGSFITGHFNPDPYQSNGNFMEHEEYMSRYFYSSENARISHTDPDPQLNPPQYSTLTTMELHPEYLSSNNQEHQLTLDIQTDELMPAHGELSGQESLEPPEPILASIWTMKSNDESQPHTSTAWDDTVHEVSTAARNLLSLKNREEIPKEEIIEKTEVKPLIGKLVCPYCKLKFDAVKARTAHIDEEHRNEEGVKKGLMYIRPFFATKMENGLNPFDQSSLKVECGICGQVFDDYIKMTSHFIDFHKGTKYILSKLNFHKIKFNLLKIHQLIAL